MLLRFTFKFAIIYALLSQIMFASLNAQTAIQWTKSDPGQLQDFGTNGGLIRSGVPGWTVDAKANAVVGDFEIVYETEIISAGGVGNGDVVFGYSETDPNLGNIVFSPGQMLYFDQGFILYPYPNAWQNQVNSNAQVGDNITLTYSRVGSTITYEILGLASGTLSGVVESNNANPIYPMLSFYNSGVTLKSATVTQAPCSSFVFADPIDAVIDTCSTEVTVPSPETTDSCNASNGALNFNGFTGEVRIPTPFQNTGGATIEGWIKTSSLSRALPLIGSIYISRFANDGKVYAFFDGSSGNGDTAANQGTTNVADGQWHHLAATNDGSTTTLYIDGILEVSFADGFIVNPNNLAIGGNVLGNFDVLNGEIDEVRFWNRPLSQAEILSMKDRVLTGNESGLVAYYDFEDGTGSSILTDRTGNGNNGTLTNMNVNTAWVTSDVPISSVTLINDFTNTANASGTYPLGQTILTWTATDASGNQSTLNQTINAGDTEVPNLAFTDPADAVIDSCSTEVIVPSPVTSDNCSTNNHALDFDGTDDWVTVNSTIDSFKTIEFWLYTENGIFGDEPFEYVFSWNNSDLKYIATGGFSSGYTNETISMVTNFGQIMTTFEDIPAGWNHIAFTGNGSSFDKILINGVSVPVANNGFPQVFTATPTEIGRNATTTSGRFNGKLDEVRFWDTPRTTQQIADNYNSSIDSSNPDLLAYYDFEDGPGSSVLADQTVNGANGVLTNMDPATDWVNDPAPVNRVTLLNDFNGTNDASGTYPIGQTTVTWTATDASGNQSTLTQTINAGDTEGPVMTCGDAINLDFCQDATIEITPPTVTDNCSNGLALDFDGSDDYLSVPRVQLLTGLTYQAWVKTSSTSSSTVYDGNSALNIIGDRTNAIWNSFGISNGQLEYHHYTSSWQMLNAPQLINDNQWHQVTVTHDETTNLVKLYIDGVEVNSIIIDYGGVSNETSVGFDTIGASYSGSNDAGEFFDGQLDEVRVWNRALSDTEISNNYNVELVGDESGLVAYFDFEDGSNNSIASDKTTNSNNGTLTNMDIASDWVYSSAPSPIILTNNITGTADASGEYPVGQTDIIWTATDVFGNTSDCTQTVTIGDALSPEIECAADISVDNDPGECTANIVVPQPIVSDNCTNDFALDFDGTDDYVDLNGSITIPSAFTIEAWIYPTSFAGSNNIITECDDPNSECNGTDYKGFFFRLLNGRLSFAGSPNNFSVRAFAYQTNNTVPLNTWTHVAAVVNTSTNAVTMYFNGVPQSGSLTFLTGSGGFSASYSPYIGARKNTFNNSATVPFSGKLDEIRIWDSQLSQTDIQNRFEDIVPGNTTGLISYYDFEDGPDSTIVTDRTGSGVDGTLTNMDPTADWEQGPDVFEELTLINDFNGTSDASGIYPVGDTTVEWMVIDALGNSSTCSQIITVTGDASCGITYTFNDGVWSPSDPAGGTSTTLDDIVIMSGNALLTGGSTLFTSCKSLTVEPGASVDWSGRTLASSTIPVFKSTSTSYSSFLGGGINAGPGANNVILYERYVNSNANGNDLISPPVQSTSFLNFLNTGDNQINLLNDGNTGPTTYAFAPFDKTVGEYVNVTSSGNLPFVRGKGYRVATVSGSILSFNGAPVNGNYTVDIQNSGPIRQKWNLVGNSYPSYFKVQDFLSHQVDVGVRNIDLFEASTAAIYGYDGNAANGWTIYNLANTTSATLIAPAQGFFVSADPVLDDVYDLSFRQDMRSSGSSDDFIQGRNTELMYLKLNLSTNNETSRTDFYFNPNASQGLDVGYDAEVFEDSTFYSHLVEDNEGKQLALQALNSSDLSNVSIPLGVHANQGEQLTFSISEMTLPASVNVYLEDVLTNTITLLNTSDYIITATSAISGTGRFFLRISEDALNSVENSLETLNIYALSETKELIINGFTQKMTILDVYDVQGRRVLSEVLDNTTLQNRIDVSKLSGGIYVVNVKNDAQRKSQKVILK